MAAARAMPTPDGNASLRLSRLACRKGHDRLRASGSAAGRWSPFGCEREPAIGSRYTPPFARASISLPPSQTRSICALERRNEIASVMTVPRARDAAAIALLAAGYVVAGKAGLVITAGGGVATPVSAPSGPSSAARVLLGQRLWPGPSRHPPLGDPGARP